MINLILNRNLFFWLFVLTFQIIFFHSANAQQIDLVKDAGTALVGSRLDDAALDAMTAACSAACNPIDDKRGTVEFRTKVAGVMARRAAKIAYNRAGGAK